MSYLQLTQIGKYYDSFRALKNIDLQVEKEEGALARSTLWRSGCDVVGKKPCGVIVNARLGPGP